MKKKQLFNYEFLIIVNNDLIEVLNIKDGTVERGFIEGNAVTKKDIIKERLEIYKKNKKIIIAGEPFIFFKETKESDNEIKKLFDSEIWKYKKREIKNFKYGYKSFKYYSIDFFHDYRQNTVFIDYFTILSKLIRNRKNDTKVMVFEKMFGIYQIMNDMSFSKIASGEIDSIQKIKVSFENIEDDSIEKIAQIKNREYLEFLKKHLISECDLIRNDTYIKEIIVSKQIKNTIKFGIAICFGIWLVFAGVEKINNINYGNYNKQVECLFNDIKEIGKIFIN